ncbi:MAG: efflux RND transporter periplasmic adaptor subunit [Sphingomonadales bacterium]|nr:efflux RND transporter periplasmic adaptor subunit [Sphingomonadales bacterium]
MGPKVRKTAAPEKGDFGPARPAAAAPAAAVIGSGHVVARHELALGSRITGQIDRVLVEAGQHVRAGMPLVELDRTDAALALRVAQAEVAQAEAAIASARAEVAAAQAPLRRLAELVPRGAASEAALEDAQLDLARLEQEVQRMQRQYDIALLHEAQARRTLSLHTIVAPFDAVVADPRAVPGQVIVETGQSGPDDTVLMTLIDTGLLYVDVDIAERNVAQIRPGLSAELRLDAWPERSFPARVISIEPRASREKGTVTARLEFAPGETGAVLVNMAAKVTFLPDTTLSALN